MNRHQPTYCNPVNISYRFQTHDRSAGIREAADPSVIRYHDEYWLFASKSSGYWYSKDLQQWTFVETKVLPVEDYAPDVGVIDGALYFTASREGAPCPVYRSTNPKADQWEKVAELPVHVDPNFFQDDDGRVYLYEGCSNVTPIHGRELDRNTLALMGERVAVIHGQPDRHGWERTDDFNRGTEPPWIEGAWMTKHQGRYYLQYAGPGTQWNVYADGVYESTSPLGPFEFARHNPYSFKPGGFITGAGHGSTFWDEFGNLWHMTTMRISVKHMFERRIGLFPAGFDKDGILFCNTSFGDYPTHFPTAKWDPWQDPFRGWMLLSYNKKATASSSLPDHSACDALNEDVRTYWSARTGNQGEWLQIDLETPCTVHAIQINFAEHQCVQCGREGGPLFHQYLLEGSVDGREWFILRDQRAGTDDMPHDYLQLEAAVTIRYLKLTNFHMPAGGTCAISGLRVFGKGNGPLPGSVKQVQAQRDPADELSAHVSWPSVLEATGYNVRWGIAPDKLYNSWLLYGVNQLELRALNKGVPYWLSVDSFNETGITPGHCVQIQE